MSRVQDVRSTFAKGPWHPDSRVPQRATLPEAQSLLRGVATALAIELGIAVIGTAIFLLI